MNNREKEIREQICEVGRRVWLKGWVASNDGNISMKLDDTNIITTPTGVSKGFMSPDMLVKIDMDGNVRSGYMKPSSESKIHIEAYRQRDDIGSVVHAHPPVCTGYAVANIPLDFKTLPEIIISLGSIPLAQYGTPSTTELSDSIKDLVLCHDAILLANHGAMTLGKDVMEAYYKMESVEHFAIISLAAHQLGGMKQISTQNVKKLEEIRDQFGIKIGGSACMNCGTCTGTESCELSTKSEYEDIVTEITEKIMKELNNQ
ncbi:MAG: class II aldolase/adducin family protein [Candidatus Latescibacteria bacterium]|nr:class II aldolase/adducin family protein [Candidatus Latescibacterota bacterium]